MGGLIQTDPQQTQQFQNTNQQVAQQTAQQTMQDILQNQTNSQTGSNTTNTANQLTTANQLSGQSGTNSQFTTQANPYALALGNNVLGAAQGIGNGQVVPTQQVADLNREQLQALYAQIGQGQSLSGFVPLGSQYLGYGANIVGGSAMPISGQDVENFYNPMAGNITAQMMNIFGQQDLANRVGATSKTGGVGGDRAAVAQSLLANQQGLAAGQTYADLYQRALAAAQQQKQQQYTSGMGLGQLGTAAIGIGQGGLQQAFSAASVPYQIQQARNLSAYQQAMQQYQDPFLRLQAQQQALAGLTGLGTSGQQSGTQAFSQYGTGSQNQQGVSQTNSQLDSTGQQTGTQNTSQLGAMTGSQIGSGTGTNQFPAAPLSGQLAGLGTAALGVGSLFGFSDREAKTDIKKLPGAEDPYGNPLYAYRYKDDPKTYPKVIGPMAQDMEKTNPYAVTQFGKYKGIAGLRAYQYGGEVDYGGDYGGGEGYGGDYGGGQSDDALAGGSEDDRLQEKVQEANLNKNSVSGSLPDQYSVTDRGDKPQEGLGPGAEDWTPGKNDKQTVLQNFLKRVKSKQGQQSLAQIQKGFQQSSKTPTHKDTPIRFPEFHPQPMKFDNPAFPQFRRPGYQTGGSIPSGTSAAGSAALSALPQGSVANVLAANPQINAQQAATQYAAQYDSKTPPDPGNPGGPSFETIASQFQGTPQQAASIYNIASQHLSPSLLPAAKSAYDAWVAAHPNGTAGGQVQMPGAAGGFTGFGSGVAPTMVAANPTPGSQLPYNPFPGGGNPYNFSINTQPILHGFVAPSQGTYNQPLTSSNLSEFSKFLRPTGTPDAHVPQFPMFQRGGSITDGGGGSSLLDGLAQAKGLLAGLQAQSPSTTPTTIPLASSDQPAMTDTPLTDPPMETAEPAATPEAPAEPAAQLPVWEGPPPAWAPQSPYPQPFGFGNDYSHVQPNYPPASQGEENWVAQNGSDYQGNIAPPPAAAPPPSGGGGTPPPSGGGGGGGGGGGAVPPPSGGGGPFDTFPNVPSGFPGAPTPNPASFQLPAFEPWPTPFVDPMEFNAQQAAYNPPLGPLDMRGLARYIQDPATLSSPYAPFQALQRGGGIGGLPKMKLDMGKQYLPKIGLKKLRGLKPLAYQEGGDVDELDQALYDTEADDSLSGGSRDDKLDEPKDFEALYRRVQNEKVARGSLYSSVPGYPPDYQDRPNSNALGVSDTEQGMATPGREGLGDYYNVRLPGSKSELPELMRKTDVGPAPYTGRGIDISAAAAQRAGLSPDEARGITDKNVSWSPVTAMGSPPGLPESQENLPGGVETGRGSVNGGEEAGFGPPRRPQGLEPSQSPAGRLAAMFSGRGDNFTNNERGMALLKAGLGMMAASGERDRHGLPTSGLAAIGKGALKGVESLDEARNFNLKERVAEDLMQDRKLRLQALMGKGATQQNIPRIIGYDENTDRPIRAIFNPETKQWERITANEPGQAGGFGPEAEGAITKRMEELVAQGASRKAARAQATKEYVGQAGKPIQGRDAKTLETGGTKLEQLNALSGGFDNQYSGYGAEFAGNTANYIARQYGVGNKAAANWWQDYQSYVNAVRHDLFGAALTGYEIRQWSQQDINPGMQPDAIKHNLERQTRIIQGALKRKAGSMMAQGYSKDAVERQMGVKIDELPDPIKEGKENFGPEDKKQDTKASEGGPPANLLKEGVATTFKDGSTWTLRNGKPEKVN